MNELPTSIEATLVDAGLTGTEIVLLRIFFSGEAFTLRELAVKACKSTGVLDSAIKKLLRKNIVKQQHINGTTRYLLHSLDAVEQWVDQDIRQKQSLMERRQESFATYVATFAKERGHKKPQLEYYDGYDGLKKGLLSLIERGEDMIMYGPVLRGDQEDPLRDFWVQFFQERQKKNLFLRVLSHDTILGRRFRSRDPFEFRKTILLSEDTYPFLFQKYIVGDTVACLDNKGDRACFIRYSELAQEERMFFDHLWNKKIAAESAATKAGNLINPLPLPPPMPPRPNLRTKILSQLRMFFLSRTSVFVMIFFGTLSCAVTFGLYRYNAAMQLERIRDYALGIASTGVLQFDLRDLDELRTPADITKPEYAKVIGILNEIREKNPGVANAYILRPTEDPNWWTFVADADSLHPYEQKDVNGDGVIDEKDAPSFPGDLLDVSLTPEQNVLTDQGIASSTDFPVADQWGVWIVSNGPIINSSGKTIALLGIDVRADMIHELTLQVFSPTIVFVCLLFSFLLIRLVALNQNDYPVSAENGVSSFSKHAKSKRSKSSLARLRLLNR